MTDEAIAAKYKQDVAKQKASDLYAGGSGEDNKKAAYKKHHDWADCDFFLKQ